MNTSVKNHPCIIQLITKLIHTVYLESVESIKTLLHSFNHVHPLGEFPATSKDTMRHLIFLQEFIIVGDHECNVQLVKNLKTLKTLFGPLMDSIERLGQEKRASASEVFLWYQKFIKYYSKLFEQASEEDENVDWMVNYKIS